MSFNKVILEGRLARDPELRFTPSGVACNKITVAIDRYSKEKEQSADFINCTAWNNTAEFINKYFNKGSGILIEGSLRTSSWTDKDGTKRYSTEVFVEKVAFPTQNPKDPIKPRTESETITVMDFDEDGTVIPF